MAQPVEATYANAYVQYITNNPNIPAEEAALYLVGRERYTESDEIAGFLHHWRMILPAATLKLLSVLFCKVRINKQTWEKRESFPMSYAELATATGMSPRTIQRMLHRATRVDIAQWQQYEELVAMLVATLHTDADITPAQIVANQGVSLLSARKALAHAQRHCAATEEVYQAAPCPWQVGDFTWTYRHQTYTFAGQVYTFNDILQLFIRKVERSKYRSSTYQHTVYGTTVFELNAVLPLPPTETAHQQVMTTYEEIMVKRQQFRDQAAAITAKAASCADTTSCPVDRYDKLSALSPRLITTTKDTDLSISLRRSTFPIATDTTQRPESNTPVIVHIAGETIRKTNDTPANDSIPYQTRIVRMTPPCESTNESDTPPPLRATPPSPVLSAEEIHGEAWRAVARLDTASVLLWNYTRLKYPALVTSIDALVGDAQNLYARKGEDDRDDYRFDGHGWWEPGSAAPPQAISWWEIRKDLRSAIEQVLTTHAPVGQLKGTTPKHLAELADLAQKRVANHCGTTKNLAGYYLTTLKNLRREYLLKHGDMEQLRLAEKKQQVRNAAKQDGVVLPVNTAPPTRAARAKQGWGETSSDPARSRGYNPRG